MNLPRRTHRDHRPRLEVLEYRLAPGDVLFGALFGAGVWPGEFPASKADVPTASIRLLPPRNADGLEASDNVLEAVPTKLHDLTLRQSATSVDIGAPLRDVASAPALGVAPRSQSPRPGSFIDNTTLSGIGATIAGANGSFIPGLATTAAQRNLTHERLPSAVHPDGPKQAPRAAADYGKLPLTFEANEGQTDARVDFIAHAAGYTAFLTPKGAVFAIPNGQQATTETRLETPAPMRDVGVPVGGVAIHMELVGGNPKSTAQGVHPLPGTVNYFNGNDPSQWRTNISTYAGVAYPDVYPGIDLLYYGNDQSLEYDFVVAPGADPKDVALSFTGANTMEINARGDLVAHTDAGDLVQPRPYIYQEVNGGRQVVDGGFRIQSAPNASIVTFDVRAYDTTRPLVIDPSVISYSTYLGGIAGSDFGKAIAVDGEGNAYTTGFTLSAVFPVTPGAFDTTRDGALDGYVAKLNPTGTALVYASYLGGTSVDAGFAIAVDAEGSAYVAGGTSSTDFPTTLGAFDTTFNGPSTGTDVFVTKFSADGTALVYSTYLAGSGTESFFILGGIAVDSDGHAYVTGSTASTDFPVTTGAFQTVKSGGVDVFVSKINPAGSALVYSTLLGDSGNDIGVALAIDDERNVYVTGRTDSINFPTTVGAYDEIHNGLDDVFVAKLDALGSTLIYSTFLGGSDREQGHGIGLDATGNAYVAGRTGSADFPATTGSFDTTYNGGSNDVFVSGVTSDGTALVYATLIGGSGDDQGLGIAVDALGNTHLTGLTTSTDLPTTLDAHATTYGGGTSDAFMATLSAGGVVLTYATYLGGSLTDEGTGIDRDVAGNVYVIGSTSSNNFPITPGVLKRRNRAGSYDAFVTKFTP